MMRPRPCTSSGDTPTPSLRYREARERAGPGLRTKIDYALGNTSLALGDVAAALRHYDACLASTVRGAPFDAVRRDAAINRQFAVEQGARPSIPPEGGGDQPPPSPRSRSNPGRDGEPSQGRPDRTGSTPPPGGDSRSDDPTGRRGAGGAGGAGPSPPRPGSPEARLEEALKSVREGRRRRLPDVAPSAVDGDRKDW